MALPNRVPNNQLHVYDVMLPEVIIWCLLAGCLRFHLQLMQASRSCLHQNYKVSVMGDWHRASGTVSGLLRQLESLLSSDRVTATGMYREKACYNVI